MTEDSNQQLASTLVHFTENSINHASLYIKHCERNCVTSEDIKRALMLEMFLFTNREGLEEKINKVKQEIYEGDSDSEEELVEPERIEDDFCESKCKCDMCMCINNIYVKWEKWTPETSIQGILKRHIDSIN